MTAWTIKDQKSLIRDVKRTEFVDPAYKAKLLSSALNELAAMRKTPRDQSELIALVRKALAVSLLPLLRDPRVPRRNATPINPESLLDRAALRVVGVLNERNRKAVTIRHSKNDKPARLRSAYETGKYPSKENCVQMHGVAKLGMSPDAARDALRNQPKPRRK